ncbi:hypothetical protein [uncultured Thiocystis sp.]|jgi:hypothetical protein|uniref:hypothetical protein n=1 Tax=uncultured Thiocystis sp. TaxID=1202134 RepID=UPI0025CC321C|nr:hypothetical protein [uncultured Thiocystis sp.]
MDALFDTETQVLWYEPRAHANPGPRKDRIYLLWPAWAHRVIAPEASDRPLNPLALAVLGIFAASRLTAKELAIHLGIQHELAAFIVADLHGSGYLDRTATLTHRGRELLDDERDTALHLVPAWVFRDPWRESLWPFIARDLSPAVTAINDQGYPDLEFGTTGKPWTQHAFMQLPSNDISPKMPEAREILRAANEQRRIAKRLERTRRSRFWDEDDRDLIDPKRVDLRRIVDIEAQAHPVFLATFLYVPQEGSDQEIDWHVCDFFGRENSLDLRRLIVDVADQQPRLAQQIDRVIGRTMIDNSFADYQRRARQRLSDAQLRLDRILTLNIRLHPLHESLVRMLDAWLEVQELDAFADARHCDNVLSECRKVLEGLFAELRETYPLNGIWKRVPEDKETRAARYRSAARDLGFTNIPQALLHVPRNQIRSVTDYKDSARLRPLVLATLLGAQDNPKHPLHGIAASSPELLELVDAMAKLAGGASHYGTNQVLNAADVNASVDKTLSIVGSLLGLPVCPITEFESE